MHVLIPGNACSVLAFTCWAIFCLLPFLLRYITGLTLRCSGLTAGTEAMGCTSAKQLSAVPNEDESQGKAYSNGDAFSGS